MLTGAPACVAFGLPSQHTVAFATPLRPGQLLLFDWQRQHVTRTVQLNALQPCAPVYSLAASPCGRLLAAATAMGTFLMCQHATMEPVLVTDAAESARTGYVQQPVVAFCGGGRCLLISRGCAVEVWDIAAAVQQADLLIGYGRTCQ